VAPHECGIRLSHHSVGIPASSIVMGVAMKRVSLILALIMALGSGLAFAQRSVGVRARQSAGAEKRVALVIGNSAYGRSMGRLVNPANDAEDMARTLRKLGFQVTHKQDLDRRGMEEALDDFTIMAQGSAVALFYFAGHGVQVDQVNYLVPLRARMRRQRDAKYEALPANKVVDYMKDSGARARIVILDACRNNPLPKSGRSAAKGLADMKAGAGTLIAFAAGPGEEADENPRGRNGLYTQELLKQMRTPGLDIVQVFQRTRQEVHRLSRQKQTPEDRNSLVGRSIYLAGAAPTTRPPAVAKIQPRPSLQPRQSINAEEELWQAIKNSKAAEDFQDYLRAYPRGRFAVTARIKIRQIRRVETKRRARLADEESKRREAKERRIAEERRRLEAERRIAEDRRRREAERNRLAEERRRKIEEDRRRQAAIRRDTGGRTWRDPVTGMEFVRVPGGSFQRGCHSGNDGQCDDDEKPVRTVQLDGFWLGKHEVTQGQWKRIMGSNPSRFKKGDNYPVEKVSWNDVQKFIRRLDRKSSASFRLPSETQWEFACRAGGKPVKFGTVNGRVSLGNANYGKNNGGTTFVGRYQANSLGLNDMSGNVGEWVQDSLTGYGKVGTDNPIFERSGAGRVFRGGSWDYSVGGLRCSRRNAFPLSSREHFIGFRLLRLR